MTNNDDTVYIVHNMTLLAMLELKHSYQISKANVHWLTEERADR